MIDGAGARRPRRQQHGLGEAPGSPPSARRWLRLQNGLDDRATEPVQAHTTSVGVAPGQHRRGDHHAATWRSPADHTARGRCRGDQLPAACALRHGPVMNSADNSDRRRRAR